MKIKPTRKIFETWAECVPHVGDLLFFNESNQRFLPARYRKFKSITAKNNWKLWPTNYRSWYGYALNRSARCAWLKTGEIERLSPDILKAIAKAQLKAKVPTLILASRLGKGILRKSLRFGKYAWITSATWKGFSKLERVSVMRAWFIQNELIFQDSVPQSALSFTVRKRLSAHGLDKILHSFRASSGGNCFAVAAAFVTDNSKLRNYWILWKPLKKHLSEAGYKFFPSGGMPLYGDILVFERDGNPVHAAIYLGDGIWFEKPGQDFYEPYRLVRLKNWKKEWPGARLAIFRR